MHTVCYKGFTIAAEHPALWIDKGDQIVRDLVDVMTHRDISLDCLRHLLRSRERLIIGHYWLPDGRGCLMSVLTEPLTGARIRTRNDLTRFFGRDRGLPGLPGYMAAKDSPEYQPAKWLVRLIDGQFCRDIRARFVPFVDRLVAGHGASDDALVLVGHGGTFQRGLPMVLANVTTAQAARGFGYTGVVEAELRDGVLHCVSWCREPMEHRC